MSKKAGLVTAIFQGDICILIGWDIKKWGFSQRVGSHCHKTLALLMDMVYLYEGQCNTEKTLVVTEDALQRGSVKVLE